MDVVDDAEGPLDPRIQIELENLNTATDNINKLEIELDEAHTAFGQLLSESTRRLKDISIKLGANCIDRARCYYEALDVARQARVQCQYQAQLFQRASEIHAAAKETVTLAEARFMSHQHEWNFDQAWQDMLNHATIKVMDAENQKAECGREHHRRATLCHDSEMKVQQLEEKYRRSIIKAQPYFELRAQYDEMLATQKECVERLQKAVKEAKRSYSSSFRALEDISNQIHQQRRDYDMVVNGPREPGVGAELVSPEDSLNYEAELNKVSIGRINSLASSNEADAEERSKDFDDVHDLKQRVDQMGGRSIDGSESFSSQWELELQASMEKLNNLSMKNPQWNNNEKNKDSESVKNTCDNDENEIVEDSRLGAQQAISKSVKNDENEQKKLPIDFQILRKLSSNSSVSNSSGDVRQSTIQNPINTILNRSKIAIRNSISKSLSNSPVNMSFSFGRTRMNNKQDEIEKRTAEEDRSKNIENEISIDRTSEENKNCNEIVENAKEANFNRRISLDNGESRDAKMANSPENTKEREVTKNHTTTCENLPAKKSGKFSSHSVDSTPIKTKNQLGRINGKSLDDEDENFVQYTTLKEQPTSKTSSVRELPLLSLFENSKKSSITRDKSCSMINLAEKQNLKALLDNPELRTIQIVSVERLANARNNLIGEHSEFGRTWKK